MAIFVCFKNFSISNITTEKYQLKIHLVIWCFVIYIKMKRKRCANAKLFQIII